MPGQHCDWAVINDPSQRLRGCCKIDTGEHNGPPKALEGDIRAVQELFHFAKQRLAIFSWQLWPAERRLLYYFTPGYDVLGLVFAGLAMCCWQVCVSSQVHASVAYLKYLMTCVWSWRQQSFENYSTRDFSLAKKVYRSWGVLFEILSLWKQWVWWRFQQVGIIVESCTGEPQAGVFNDVYESSTHWVRKC